MDKSPFQFGKLASGSTFINRQEDIKKLSSNFISGINTILVSPRRWGKSSLVEKVSETLSVDGKTRICIIDMFNTRSEEAFYQLFSKQLIKSTSARWEEWIKTAKSLLSKISPKISVSADNLTEMDIQFEYKHNKISEIELLDLPEKIARSKKIRLIVCIDEFQNIENFDDPVGFQQKIRAQWQKHKNVVYCLYGSKRHMLMQLFEKRSMPLYRFGDVIYLDKIAKEHWLKYIVNSFHSGKKKISPDIAGRIVDSVKCHPYYVQQFAHIVWNNTYKKVTNAIFDKSMEDLVTNNVILFEREFQFLSNGQINFLHALKDGVSMGFTSNEVIRKYNLGSSSNVIRIISALEDKEIIDRFTNKIEFVDPVFELWLKWRL